jgi:putative FmdB family regulatory protein
MVFIVWGIVMPIYVYRCGACGYQKEFLKRLSDAPLTKCPECGKRAFNKRVTAAGFHLKGTGWYATDFKNSGTKPAAKQEKTEAKQEKTEAKQEKAESKQEKAESKQEKAESKQDKPAESSGKESSKTEPSRGAGASQTST